MLPFKEKLSKVVKMAIEVMLLKFYIKYGLRFKTKSLIIKDTLKAFEDFINNQKMYEVMLFDM